VSKVQAWWIAGILVLLVLLGLMLVARHSRPVASIPGGETAPGLPVPAMTVTLPPRQAVSPALPAKDDPDAFPGAAALLNRSEQAVITGLGRSDDYQDMGLKKGVRCEKYIYYDKLYGVRELVIDFENGRSRRLTAYFLEYKDFSVEDAFSALGIAFPEQPALRQERYTAGERYYFWENYAGFKKIEIISQRQEDHFELTSISVEK
jgi:hypothetical protein